MKTTKGSHLTLMAFLAMVVLAAGNAVAVKFTVRELDPFWGAALRFSMASLLFLVLMLFLRVPWPRGRALAGDVVYGVLTYAAPFGLFYWGVQDAPVAAAGVILAGVPLLTLILASIHGIEKFTLRGLAGSLIVIAGLLLVLRDQLNAAVPLSSLLAFLASAVAFAESLIAVKWFPKTHPVGKNAIGMGVGGLLLLMVSIGTRESLLLPRESTTRIATAYLVILGSVAVFSLYLFVLGGWTASATSYEGVLIPFVTVGFSAWLLDERITPVFGVGAAIVVAGVYLGALSGAPEATDIRVPAADETGKPPVCA